MPSAKNAVIVFGEHFAGKSYTLKEHFKPLVGLSGGQRVFHLTDTKTNKLITGEVRTQSFEEAGHSTTSLAALLATLSNRDLLVVATRPPSEAGSLYSHVESTLMNNGFNVSSVEIVDHGGPKNPPYYIGRAKQIYSHL
ncbi:hypothetical protein HYN73_22170 [Vibrio parahaemolyticus]|uniref:hypothetical protein n=1 Tax=Vibrio parahaemolyticus TaxID=670 RepID=UPI0004D67BC8|nr:hypothetical protein [Vibrio parahaemolyticus]EGR1699980.1 hypothetical protein [Vibrio parahaemolyticus]MBM5193757.1 hypothetical protein [Vibrio parahaemolyticus]MBM5203018.1 hypothetical protein [Vibrio parahaemolyticus]MBM5204924.1 hypothetical protein [Vibrio parahaemolyticus]MBM5211523.1 hypothetical protein [Vibrio parahaemolyticus]